MSDSNNKEQSRSLFLPLALLLAFLLLVAGLILAFRPGLLGLGGNEPVVVEPTVAAQAGDDSAESALADAPQAQGSGEASVGGEFTVSAAGASLSAAKTTADAFGQLLPLDTTAGSDVYVIEGADGARGELRVAVPDGIDSDKLDLYGWSADQWSHIPSNIIDGEMVSSDAQIPNAVVALKVDQPSSVAFGAEALPGLGAPEALFDTLTEISVGTLTLGMDGELLGGPIEVADGNYDTYLRSTNTGIIVDAISLSTVIDNSDIQAEHIADLVARVFGGGYRGLNLDYQGASPNQRDAFTRFVSSLDRALAAQNLDLAVTLATPQLVDGQWQTSGQDWAALGQIADVVYLRMPLDPTVYGEQGLADQMVRFATRQISRHKLSLFLTSNAIDKVGEAVAELPGEVALSNFGELQLLQGGNAINIGDTLEVGLSGSASPLEWDGAAATFKYTYDQAGQMHTIWLDNEGALAHRMELAKTYNLRGVMVRGLGSVQGGDGYTAAFNSIVDGEAPAAQSAALVWTVTGSNGDIVASETSSDKFTFAWPDVQLAGDYDLTVDFALGDNRSTLGDYAFSVADPVQVAEAAAAEGEAEAEAEEAVAEEPVEGEAVAEESATEGESVDSAETTSEEAATDEAVADNGSGDAVNTIETNYRSGPGFATDIIEILDISTPLAVEGRDGSGQWLKVSPVGTDKTGWVFASLVQFNEPVVVADLPIIAGTEVVQVVAAADTSAQQVAVATVWPTATRVWPTNTPGPVGPWFTATPTRQPFPTAIPTQFPTAIPTQAPTDAPPTLTPFPTAVPPTATPVWPTRTPTPWPTKTPWPTRTPAPQVVVQPTSVPVVSNPIAGGGGFEIGAQTHTLANPGLMANTGMKWVKFQHKWGPDNNGSEVAGRIEQAHANGFKVLLSMPGANVYPSSIDFASYITFLGNVARLQPAPDAIEIWNEMNIDFEWPAGSISPSDYVNKMLKPGYQAIKAANPNIMVISGAPAPTGFDNGTNAWADDRYMAGVAQAGGANYMDCIGVHYNAGATSPSQTQGHPADGGARHYSWYFGPTMNMYYNAFGGSRKVCFTELGYVSSDGYSGLPPNFSWAKDTSVGEHAQWLAEAVSLSANSGRVRMLIVFNIDFTLYSDTDPQAGYAMLRPNGQCPACDTIRAVMGR